MTRRNLKDLKPEKGVSRDNRVFVNSDPDFGDLKIDTYIILRKIKQKFFSPLWIKNTGAASILISNSKRQQQNNQRWDGELTNNKGLHYKKIIHEAN